MPSPTSLTIPSPIYIWTAVVLSFLLSESTNDLHTRRIWMKWGIYKLVLRENITIYNCKYEICGRITSRLDFFLIIFLWLRTSETQGNASFQRLHLTNLGFKHLLESWEPPAHSLPSFLTRSSTKILELWSAKLSDLQERCQRQESLG